MYSLGMKFQCMQFGGGGSGSNMVTIAPFTLALKPVSNRFRLNRFGQTTSLCGLQKAVSKVH